ncbi:MAG: type IV pilus biogenesis protein PilM [Desulfovibrio sp.]|jgi:hypothetical protein|nr:type IV pilus biogenesis protein PilM [Desulfovibrio sp.]
MNVLAVMCFLLGILAWMSSYMTPSHDIAPDANAIATNYIIYRNAAFNYAEKHHSSGVISSSSLTLPSGWTAVRNWQARIDSSHCYVWGQATNDEISAARKLLWESYATGRAESGRLVPGNGAVISLPAFVGNGNLVSVIRLD